MRTVLICTVGTSLKGNPANAQDKKFAEMLEPDKKKVKFDIVTTAAKTEQRDAAIADLSSLFN